MNRQLSLLVLVLFCASSQALVQKRDKPIRDPVPSICKNFVQNYTNYPCEELFVLTEDGFELSLIHIPASVPNAKVVFLQHGLLGSAAAWFDMAPTQSLGYILHQQGFDVWAGNARGNVYSSKNIYWPTDGYEIWELVDFDTMASQDLPTLIHYITRVTGAEKIVYIGHSQGTTEAFAAFSNNYKDINSKIALYVAFAPITRALNIAVPALRAMANDNWNTILQLFGQGPFPPNDMSPLVILEKLAVQCLENELCGNLLYDFGGANITLINITQVADGLDAGGAGTSMKCMHHWLQAMQYDGFRMFDYGYLGNLIHYGKLNAPNYDLSKVNVPMALYSGLYDVLATYPDVDWTISQLPAANILVHQVLPYQHNDFIWALNAPQILYPQVIQLINTRTGDDARRRTTVV